MPYGSDINSAGILGSAAGAAFEADVFAEMIRREFDQLYDEGAESGTIMCIALHTYLTAQPHRSRIIREAVEYVLGHSGVWQATAGDIAEYYLEHYYARVVASLGWPSPSAASAAIASSSLSAPSTPSPAVLALAPSPSPSPSSSSSLSSSSFPSPIGASSPPPIAASPASGPPASSPRRLGPVVANRLGRDIA